MFLFSPLSRLLPYLENPVFFSWFACSDKLQLHRPGLQLRRWSLFSCGDLLWTGGSLQWDPEQWELVHVILRRTHQGCSTEQRVGVHPHTTKAAPLLLCYVCQKILCNTCRGEIWKLLQTKVFKHKKNLNPYKILWTEIKLVKLNKKHQCTLRLSILKINEIVISSSCTLGLLPIRKS